MGFLTGKLGIYLALITACLIAIAVTTVSCNRHWGPKPEPRTHTYGPYAVAAVTNGASLTCSHGRRDRRSLEVAAEHISAPAAGEPLAQESQDNLARIAGESVTVEVEGRRRLREDVMEAGPSRLVGLVRGSSGGDVALEQLRAGLARCEPDAPKEYRQAEAEAQKAKIGIWAKTKRR